MENKTEPINSIDDWNTTGTLYIVGKTIPEVWETSVRAVYKHGIETPTEYDKEGDPPTKEMMATLVVEQPLGEPRIHKCFPMSVQDLFNYSDEVVKGTNDHLKDKYGYTYHDRLVHYPISPVLVEEPTEHDDKVSHLVLQPNTINQLAEVCRLLKENWCTRRAQAIIWVPEHDLHHVHPPCAQRLWFRVRNTNPGEYKLDLHVHMRSNDAYKAAFMNMFAFTDLQMYIAGILGYKMGKYIHIADSYHIYGSYMDDVKRFIANGRSMKENTWTTAEALDIVSQ